MRQPLLQFERSTTPENSLLTQSLCKFCHRIIGTTPSTKLLTTIEHAHVCAELPQTNSQKPAPQLA